MAIRDGSACPEDLRVARVGNLKDPGPLFPYGPIRQENTITMAVSASAFDRVDEKLMAVVEREGLRLAKARELLILQSMTRVQPPTSFPPTRKRPNLPPYLSTEVT